MLKNSTALEYLDLCWKHGALGLRITLANLFCQTIWSSSLARWFSFSSLILFFKNIEPFHFNSLIWPKNEVISWLGHFPSSHLCVVGIDPPKHEVGSELCNFALPFCRNHTMWHIPRVWQHHSQTGSIVGMWGVLRNCIWGPRWCCSTNISLKVPNSKKNNDPLLLDWIVTTVMTLSVSFWVMKCLCHKRDFLVLWVFCLVFAIRCLRQAGNPR